MEIKEIFMQILRIHSVVYLLISITAADRPAAASTLITRLLINVLFSSEINFALISTSAAVR
ncbi:hypothetical protein BpHYR1_003803 [Brachionus plicatilis]|uniref:Uncharacterized protein n=1 Tax=Brachionus plicatilis TaxID=10195 RepID=A0A3M7RNQ1_BRAPC|nr:hypothetical protein BpHYR1_003803 [Brachionus plicatilis]